MLCLHERTRDDGSIERTYLDAHHGGDEASLSLHVDGEAPRSLPLDVLMAVMKRYGRVLDDAVTFGPDAERLAVGGGVEVVHFRHLAKYDVIARDWIALIEPHAEPIAELSTAVSGALRHLLAVMDARASGA